MGLVKMNLGGCCPTSTREKPEVKKPCGKIPLENLKYFKQFVVVMETCGNDVICMSTKFHLNVCYC